MQGVNKKSLISSGYLTKCQQSILIEIKKTATLGRF
jgi:hypothetical protein